ncbi:MAG: toxin-antitoxin system YwqK family antitoxin [Crocinitomicaceae bacterium]
MMKKLKLILLLICMPFAIHSQSSPEIFFDKNWNLSTEDNYRYYRVIHNSTDSLIISDYYKNGNLQSAAICNKEITILDSIKLLGNLPDSLIEKVSYFDKKGRIINIEFNDSKYFKTQLPKIINDSLQTGRFNIDGLSYEKYYRKNGEISWEAFAKGNKSEGLYLEYYGKTRKYKLAAIAVYRNDLLNGTVVNLYSDGSLMRTTTYKEGLKEGACVHYDGFDNIVWIKTYQNGHPIKKTSPNR